FRGGKQTSGLSTLQSVGGSNKGGDDVGASIGKSGGIPDGGVLDGSGGDTGSGGDGICGSREGNRVSGDGGGVRIEINLSTSASDENGRCLSWDRYPSHSTVH
ncbi:hypothetical protein Tco_1580172, partial [Tanacetum coccineum]